jgi:hypothetical protein
MRVVKTRVFSDLHLYTLRRVYFLTMKHYCVIVYMVLSQRILRGRIGKGEIIVIFAAEGVLVLATSTSGFG